jgi:hypothetical protein
MLSQRLGLWRVAVVGVAAPLLLVAAYLLSGGAAVASATPAGAPAGPDFLCANGGAGLCLETSGVQGTLVANDNKIQPPLPTDPETWGFNQLGVTSATGPFDQSNLNKQVAAGRRYGQWQNINTDACMAFSGGRIIADVGCFEGGQPRPGTEWVLSGSGRIINVLDSNDQINVLEFLNSSGVNGGHPSLSNSNTCPRACWGPNAG